MPDIKTKVTVNCLAGRYANPGERIIEFTNTEVGKGGLIAFRVKTDGNLHIDVYRCDAGVIVNGVEVKADA